MGPYVPFDTGLQAIRNGMWGECASCRVVEARVVATGGMGDRNGGQRPLRCRTYPLDGVIGKFTVSKRQSAELGENPTLQDVRS